MSFLDPNLETCIGLLYSEDLYSEAHIFARIFAHLNAARMNLSSEVVCDLVAHCISPGLPRRPFEQLFGHTMVESLPMIHFSQNYLVELFVYVTVLVYNLDSRKLDQLKQSCLLTLKKVNEMPSNPLADVFISKVFYFIARGFEIAGVDCLGLIMVPLRMAISLKEHETQAVLVNAVLRQFILKNDFVKSFQFLTKVPFPASASPSQQARYNYYCGRIQAVRQNFRISLDHLILAEKNIPTSEFCGTGFRIMVLKLSILVKLLVGKIPRLSVFSSPWIGDREKELFPYMLITNAVRAGDMNTFGSALNDNEGLFRKDQNYLISSQLRHSVIRICLRNVSVAYDRIPLSSIANRLNLNQDSVEFIAAKAIRDGFLGPQSTIDHELQVLVCGEEPDIYSTDGPFEEFQSRIKPVIDLYSTATKNMRYEAKQKKVEDSDDSTHEDALQMLMGLMEDM